MLDADPLSSQFQALRDRVELALGFRDRDGKLVRGSYDRAIRTLTNFATASGQLPKETRDVLGQADYGRDDVLFDLLRSLVGPEPILEAWLEAIEAGSFKKLEFVGYRPDRSDGKKPNLGPPGTFLPRLLAKMQSDLAEGRRPHVNRILFTETSMMTLVVIASALQDATRAAAALGIAYVVMAAVDDLTAAQHRQLDANAGNPEFLAALRVAIGEVLARFPVPAESERTAAQIKKSLPRGVDIEHYFSERDERQAHRVRSEFLDAFRRLATGKAPSEGKSSIYDKVVRKVADPREVTATATRYLDFAEFHSEVELAEHHVRLREVMIDLTHPCSPEALKVRAMMATNQRYPLRHNLSGIDIIDRGCACLAERIFEYARDAGPPPPGVPLLHVRLFEDVAIYLGLKGEAWPAKEKWQLARLLGDHIKALSAREIARLMTMSGSWRSSDRTHAMAGGWQHRGLAIVGIGQMIGQI